MRKMKKKNTKTPLLFLLLLFSSILTVQSQINVWPKPRKTLYPNPHSSLLSPIFQIPSPNPPHPHLIHAIHRYLHQILTTHHIPIIPPPTNLSQSPPLKSLTLSITSPSTTLHHGVDESYNLSIPTTGSTAHLSSPTPWGAMRGLETFSQLVWWDGRKRRRKVARGVWIWDAPLMQHRGVLVDTARNFYGVGDLERTIGAMSMNKMNVFHWHLTDSQSFPLVLEKEGVRDLGKKGAYGVDMQYSAEDVRRIVEFGMRHGVRVLPEIDTPGMRFR